MTRLQLSQGMTPSVLDRLMDPDSAGTAAQRGYTVDQIVVVVRRDLEELLNTRLGRIDIPPQYKELQKSPLNFGLPDFGSIPTASQQNHDSIGRRIELAVSRFEPRLRDVRVHLIEDVSESGRLTLRFQIEARLRIEPYPDVSFETVLELTTGCAVVTAARK